MDKKAKVGCEKVIKGQANFKAASLGLSMLFTRLAASYKSAPSPATLDKCLVEVNTFFEKYAKTLEVDSIALQHL